MAKFTLKSLRVNAGLTQEQLAEEFNVTVNTIRNWEAMRSFPSAPQCQMICNYYGVPFDMICFTEKVN